MAAYGPPMRLADSQPDLLENEYICTGCRYVLTVEWFGYRPDRPEGTRFTTCIGCRNRGRKTCIRRRGMIPLPTTSGRGGQHIKQQTNKGGPSLNTTNVGKRIKPVQDFDRKRVLRDRPTTRSSTVNLRASAISDSTVDEPEITVDGFEITADRPMITADGPMITADEPVVTADEPMITADRPMITADGPMIIPDESVVTADEPMITADKPIVTANESKITINGPEMQHLDPTAVTDRTESECAGDGGTSAMTHATEGTQICPNVSTISTATPPHPASSDLDIIFCPQAAYVSVDPSVMFFKSAYPPSLEIFLVMLQIRHEILLEENIMSIHVESGGLRLRVLGLADKGAGMWEVVMNIMFKKGLSVKVDVEAIEPSEIYCTFITKVKM